MSDPLFKKHEPCPECGSRDNVGVWANGSEHCFSPDCTYHITGTGETMQIQQEKTTTLTKGTLKDIPDRNITEATCRKYEVTVQGDKHFYPLFDNAGIHVANKVRLVNKKDFYSEG